MDDKIKINLENFKTFQNKESFEIAPISIFIGPNNSGKSSFIKFLHLLNFNFTGLKNGFGVLDCKKFGSFRSLTSKYSDKEELKFEISHLNPFTDSILTHEYFNYFNSEYDWENFQIEDYKVSFTYFNNDGNGLLKGFDVLINGQSIHLMSVQFNTETKKYRIYVNIGYFFNSIEEFDQTFGFKDFLDEAIGYFTNREGIEEIERKKEKILHFTYMNLYELENIESKFFDLMEHGFLAKNLFPNIQENREENEAKKLAKRYTKLIVEDFIEPFFAYFHGHTADLYGNLTFPKKFSWIITSFENRIIISSQKQNFINQWLQKFGIGSEINIHEVDDEVQIVYIKKNGAFIKLKDLGEGPQGIVLLLLGLSEDLRFNRFVLSEPEKGLHPKLQSQLADLIVDMKRQFDADFVIETHSEYFIRKLQVLIAKNEISNDKCIINYLKEPTFEKENENNVYQIGFKSDGRFNKEFGQGFYDEASSLMVDHFKLIKGK